MRRYELDLRNMWRPTLMGYLEGAGGKQGDGWLVEGDGWRAWLEEQPPVTLATISIRRDLLIIEGEPEAAERVYRLMREKTMRGGG
ncbi:MAG: hypothetical protein Kow00124_17700 [Anaerolineae bacterium]